VASFSSFGAFAAEVGKLAREIDKDAQQRITREMGEKAQEIAKKAASADLGGDAKFSGWVPPLDTQLKPGRNNSTLLTPTRESAGPWTVAQSGRNQGNASGFSGPGINTRTGRTSRTKSGGIRKVRVRGTPRWNGYTDGKDTADDARRMMESELPKVAEDGVRKVLMRYFDVN
jgi:hypothetical protein